MKRQLTRPALLALIVLLAAAGVPGTAEGQQPQRFRVDSGVVTLGVNQVLRVTVAGALRGGAITVRTRWMVYAASGCSGSPPVCRQSVASQGVSPFQTLGADDALSFDVEGTGAGGRVMVESNSRTARVNMHLIDLTTGQTVSLLASSEIDTW